MFKFRIWNTSLINLLDLLEVNDIRTHSEKSQSTNRRLLLLVLTLLWRRSLSCRNQSTDLLCKPMGWFLYDRDIRHERDKYLNSCCKSLVTYGGQLSHEWPSTITLLLKMHVHNTMKDKVNMSAIFIYCPKEAIESRTNLFFYL